MKARALERLEALEGQDPANPEIRTRLLSLYKEARRYRDAAEQCLLLAAIHRRTRDEDTARKCLAEAGKLAPEWVVPDFDVAAFAQARGIATDRRKAAGSAPLPSQDDALEIDLSEDISEVFFKDSPAASLARGPAKAPSGGPEIGEEYPPGAALRVPAAESLNDKLPGG